MMRKFVLCAFLVLIGNELVHLQKRGIQLRLTSKGFDYAMQISMALLQKDVNGKKLKDHSGNKDGTKYTIRNIQISRMSIGSGSYLRPTYGSGLNAKVTGISLHLTAQISYEKKIGWFKIRDTVNVNADVGGVSFTTALIIGRRSDGRPSLTSASCSSKVDRLNLKFSGSRASWLYNLISGFIENKLKGEVSEAMCDSAKKAIQERGDSELRTFPVKKKIDRWATLDYSMSSNPVFTNSYMDVFLKGEFLSNSSPKESSLTMPSFPTSSDLSKMLYFWITDYTLNTAGEVYHSSGRLSFTAKSSDPKIESRIRKILHTNKLKSLIPELFRKYPNRPMNLRVHSYKAPTVSIKPDKIDLNVYASITFQVVLESGAVKDVFSIFADITIGGSVFVNHGKLKGQLNRDDLKISLEQGKSTVGPIVIPLNNPLTIMILKGVVVKGVQPLVMQGMPLPNLGDVDLVEAKITQMQGVIRIGTDCNFISKTHD